MDRSPRLLTTDERGPQIEPSEHDRQRAFARSPGDAPVNIDTDDIVSVTEASQRFSKILNDVSENGRRIVVMKNNCPAAVITDIETMNRLQRVEEAEEDLKLLSIAWVRTMTDSGARHSLEDVAAEFDIDLAED
ncbi:type II toxin-antitoxin system Phd/YefM family antitoxin [Amycolatopsis keratiniphila]|uniref:type II toxin-antitoxin system Phd/YefM family antitoxin n=1 Tax=Amycolatopsis keratiniphila TaxID=129921 RepID=UPI00130D9270|nr:type II toxin-antitoxin system Phd/YefM family antitoxin [Amycolatopsis keratiniphila]